MMLNKDIMWQEQQKERSTRNGWRLLTSPSPPPVTHLLVRATPPNPFQAVSVTGGQALTHIRL